MSEQNIAFEKFFPRPFKFADKAHELETMSKWNYAKIIWEQSIDEATAEANKRIEALEGEVAELQERLETHIAINKSLLLQRDCLQADNKRLREGVAIIKNSSDSIKTILELQATNHDLREALEKAMNDEAGWYEIAKQALSATPAESLQAHDAKTIKRYADDLDNNHWVFIPHDLRKPLKEVK